MVYAITPIGSESFLFCSPDVPLSPFDSQGHLQRPALGDSRYVRIFVQRPRRRPSGHVRSYHLAGALLLSPAPPAPRASSVNFKSLRLRMMSTRPR